MEYPFDQYQRYKNVQEIINELRKDDQSFRILEVGANEHRNLEFFLPKDQITYLDIQLPEHLLEDPQYILGDATAMNFEDNTFDIIVALDVFEHIFPEQRENFIKELQRVSQQFFIITAPFFSKKVEDAEKRLNTLYRSLYNEGYIWLEEHYINGLPKVSELTAFLNQENIKYTMLSHGDVNIWERMMSVHFFAVRDVRLKEYRILIDKYYNENLYDLDYIDDSYRKIVIGYTNHIYDDSPIVRTNKGVAEKLLQKLDFLEREFYQLANIVPNLPEKQKDFLQIYVDNGKGFNEEQSFKVEVNNKVSDLEFDLNDLGDIKFIRIDPSNFKGVFKIDHILIKDPNDNILETSEAMGEFHILLKNIFIFSSDDPHIYMEIIKPSSAKKLSFSLEVLDIQNIIFPLVMDFKEKEKNNTEDWINKINIKDEKIHELNEYIHQMNNDFNAQNMIKVDEYKRLEAQYEQMKYSFEDATNNLEQIQNSRSYQMVQRLKRIIKR